MKAIGSGVMDIRIHKEGEWRVIYVAKFGMAVHVLHAFEKRPRKPGKPTSSLLSSVTKRSGASHEEENHQVHGQRLPGPRL
jgi:phage-related protein